MDGELLRDLGNLGVPSDSGYDPNIWRKLQRQGKLIPTDVVFDNNWAFSLGLQSIKRAAPPFNRPTGVVVGPQGDIFCQRRLRKCFYSSFLSRWYSSKDLGWPWRRTRKIYYSSLHLGRPPGPSMGRRS